MFVWDLRGLIVDSVQLPAMKPHLFIETFWKQNWHSGRFEGLKSQSAKDMLKGHMYHVVSASLKRNTCGKGLKVRIYYHFSHGDLWSSQVPPFNTAVLHFAAWVLAMDLVRNLIDLHARTCIEGTQPQITNFDSDFQLGFWFATLFMYVESSYRSRVFWSFRY